MSLLNRSLGVRCVLLCSASEAREAAAGCEIEMCFVFAGYYVLTPEELLCCTLFCA